MYNYTNSLRDKFNIPVSKIDVRKNSDITNDSNINSAGIINSLPSVTPDYNVKIPTGYSKIGVEKLSNGQEIHCYKLNNGQKVYIAPKESALTVVNTYVNTGSMNEKDSERGISHFCEHMAFNGTTGNDGYLKLKQGDVFGKVLKMGGYTNASTGFAETNYTISIPQFNESDFEEAVKIQASMMNNLEMSDEMVEKEHGPVTSEINMYSDRPSSVVQNIAMKNLYNIQTTSNDIIAGTVDNILNIDKAKVMDYYKNNYYPANMSTVVTGDVNPDDAIEIISKHFRGQNPPNPERRVEPLKPIKQTVRKDIFSDKAVGATGVICFNGPDFNNLKDNMAISVLNRYLFNKDNSKIENELKPYSVSVYATVDKFSSNPKDGRLISVSYDSTDENSEIALRQIFTSLANFQPPTTKELENIKTELKIINEKGLENMDLLNSDIGACVSVGNIDAIVKSSEVLESLTPQDIVNAVHKYFDINKASVAIVHPSSSNLQQVSQNHENAKSISFKGVHNDNSVSTKKFKQPINLSAVNRYKTNNNVEVALLKSNNEISNYSLVLKSIVPPDIKPGVASLLSTMLSEKQSKFKDFSDNNNLSLNINSSENMLSVHTEVPSKNLDASMNLIKELLFNPDFSQENFENSKKKLKNILSISQADAYENSLPDVFPNSYRGYTNKDVYNNLDNIQLADVVGLYQYIKDNSFAVCSASLPLDKYPEVKSVFDNQLASLPIKKSKEIRIFNDFKSIEKTRVVRDSAPIAQADIVETFKFYNDHTSKSIASNQLINMILSQGEDTGLYNNLREKQKLAYSVYSDYDNSQYSSSTLSCCIKTTTDSPDYKAYDNVQKSINGFNTQISKLVNGEFTDEEFQTAKLLLKRSLLEETDLQEGKILALSNMMTSSFNDIDEFNQIYKAIDSLTKDEIIERAKYIFSQKPIYSIRASQATLDANKEFLDKLEN